QEGEDEGEHLVPDGAIRVDPDYRRGTQQAQGERAAAREAPVEPVLKGRKGAEPAVNESLHSVAGARTATGLSRGFPRRYPRWSRRRTSPEARRPCGGR